MKQVNGIIDSTAIAYFLSYKCLIDKHIEVCDFDSDYFSAYFIPAITTATFSCELALKNIIKEKSGKVRKGHDLYKLFCQLDQEYRTGIIDRVIEAYNSKSQKLGVPDRISSTEFIGLLETHKDTFTIWRYHYEGTSNLDLDFIEALMFCLNGVEGDYHEYVLSQITKRKIKG